MCEKKDIVMNFPVDKFMEDLELQRLNINDMIELKNYIVENIKNEDMLIIEIIEENESGDDVVVGKQINNNAISNIVRLNDSITTSFKELNDSYNKIAKSIDSIAKAHKSMNDSKIVKDDKKGDKDIDTEDQKETIKKANNLFNIK